jgi:glycogen synthase
MVQRLRIGLLSYEYPPDTGLGGIGTYTRTQAQALTRAGHEVHVLAGSSSPGTVSCREEGDVTVWRDGGTQVARRLGALLGSLGWWWSRNRFENGLRMRRLLRRAAAQQEFDLIEVPECGAEGLFLGRRFESRKIVRFHSPAALIMPFYVTRPGDRRLCARFESRGYRRAAAATACSQFLAREMRERLAFPTPIVTVPNGIDLDASDSAVSGGSPFDLRVEVGATAEEPVVLFAGRFEPRKGSKLLCDLVPELLAQRAVRFVVLGEDLFGEAAGELAARCRAGRLRGSLHLLGRRPTADVGAAMRQADVVLLPSRWENAPYAVLEAMAAAAPLVVSRVGGLHEMVEHEREALLAEDQDVAAHLAAVERLLDDRAWGRSLGGAARARAAREFSADRMAASSLEVYRRVVTGGA